MDNPDAIGRTLEVKVSDADSSDPATSATSANFQIKGSLTITSPVSSNISFVGASHPITWTETGTTGMGTLNLAYSKNGGADNYPYSITTGVAYSAGSYSWTIPDAIGSQVSVEIVDNSDATVYSTSANFSIKGSLTLTAPTGGQTFYVGNSNSQITWTYRGA